MQFSTRRRGATAVLLTGCVVGLLDGAAAILNAWFRSGTTPEIVFKFIASAIFGGAAYTGGSGMIAVGVFLHFLVAIIWSAIFFRAYPRLRILQQNKWIVGCAYGLFVWLMMTLVVVPLTKVPDMPFNWQAAARGWVIHMLLVGIPIVLMTRHWYRITVKFP